MQTATFTNLGPGLGFRPAHYREILSTRPKSIGWLEVISENFMNVGGKPRTILSEAREHYPIAIHGVGLSIGSDLAPSDRYLQQLNDLVAWLKPALISDHLCFTSHGRHNSHDLLPVPFTKKFLDRISDRLNHIQDLLGRRFMLENPSAYVAYADNDMSEVDFFCELIERTGAGILLDLNNLYVNQLNLGLDPLHYLKTLPPHAVGQIHLAGHSVEETEEGIVRIDTHDHSIKEEVWSLYQIARHKWPEASAMVEWDDHLPELSELLPLLERIRSTQSDVRSFASRSTMGQTHEAHVSHGNSEHAQSTFFAMAVDANGIESDDQRLSVLDATVPVPPRLGMAVYNNAYFARLRDILRDEFPTLAGVTTDEGFTAIAADYLQKIPPSEPSVNALGRGLSEHLKTTTIDSFDFGVSLHALADIAALDDRRSATFIHPANEHALHVSALGEITPEAWEHVRFDCNQTLSLITTQYDIAPVWAAIHNDRLDSLAPPSEQATTLRVWRHEEHVHHAVMNGREKILLESLMAKTPFGAVVENLIQSESGTAEELTTFAVTTLAQWTESGLIAGIII